ncbi:M14 family zinc carboxypeptidase [Streptomyces durhamensis]|uniref:M14 family zinc carboxypeptidase n=1 Tax=Streptomyces durhamensis TaxID=68194 RepID=UPI00099B2E67|nr:M14 family zinc carboxypeptidase [Streptomyces durhamensis]
MRTRRAHGRALRPLFAAPAGAVVLAALLAPPPTPASGPSSLDRAVLSTDRAVPRPCHSAVLGPGAPGVSVREVTSPADGVLRARLTPRGDATGDWDLAVFDKAGGTLVDASSGPHSRELAEGTVTRGQRLVVQGCRYSGRARTVSLDVEVVPGQGQPAPARPAATPPTPPSALPSGRTAYRQLYDYQYELKELARTHPSLVTSITLPYLTAEGREVSGVEVATDPARTEDGKPVMLTLGLHHASEWPSGEIAMEWAYELTSGYRTDPRIRALVRRTRSVIVPVVDPDGFAVSRTASPKGDFSRFDYEDKRKNCEAGDSPPEYRTGPCSANPAGRMRGVDLNRNYAGFWGGAGASPLWDDDHYRGSAPFSEPETRNVRSLVSTRQVTDLVTLHTYGDLVVRPPGSNDTQPPLDEPAYRALSDRLASHNGYRSIPARELYEATGMTEDWSYWATGGFGLTLEIGPRTAHPPYAEGVVAEYNGTAPAAGAGKGGNRAALLEMLADTADPATHATVTGTAPRGYRLRLHKSFRTPTSPVRRPDGSQGPPLEVADTLDSRLLAPGGRFTWSVNPSTRPYVAGRYGREPQAPVQPALPLAHPSALPPVNTDYPTNPAADRVPFTVEGPPRADNGRMTVSVNWRSRQTEWDLYVLDPAGKTVGESVVGDTDSQQVVMFDPPPGRYTAVVVDFQQADPATPDAWTGRVDFRSPLPTVHGPTEAYTLTCADRAVHRVGSTEVTVGRGQRVDVGQVCGSGGRRADRQGAGSGPYRR